MSAVVVEVWWKSGRSVVRDGAVRRVEGSVEKNVKNSMRFVPAAVTAAIAAVADAPRSESVLLKSIFGGPGRAFTYT